jgi:hypothetical protein
VVSGANQNNGNILLEKKPFEDGTAMLALVRHGPIWTPNGKAMSKSEIFNIFRKNIENKAQSGPVEESKRHFLRKNIKVWMVSSLTRAEKIGFLKLNCTCQMKE